MDCHCVLWSFGPLSQQFYSTRIPRLNRTAAWTGPQLYRLLPAWGQVVSRVEKPITNRAVSNGGTRTGAIWDAASLDSIPKVTTGCTCCRLSPTASFRLMASPSPQYVSNQLGMKNLGLFYLRLQFVYLSKLNQGYLHLHHLGIWSWLTRMYLQVIPSQTNRDYVDFTTGFSLPGLVSSTHLKLLPFGTHDLKQEMHGPVTLVEDVAGTATASAKSSTVLETILLQDAHAKRKDQRNMRDVVQRTYCWHIQDALGKEFLLANESHVCILLLCMAAFGNIRVQLHESPAHSQNRWRILLCAPSHQDRWLPAVVPSVQIEPAFAFLETAFISFFSMSPSKFWLFVVSSCGSVTPVFNMIKLQVKQNFTLWHGFPACLSLRFQRS